MKKIAIGIGTANRPKMLSQTLDSLVSAKIPEDFHVEVLLLDNAPENPVNGVVKTYTSLLKVPIQYFLEPAKGIVSMRNRIVEEAMSGDFDYLAFIDDDEVISEGWLTSMIDTLTRYQADVVSGRTLRKLPENTPDHLKDFFKKGTRPTGIQRPTSSTCNVLFDLKKLCGEWNMRFDMRLNFVGSSDILFFNQAHKKGAKIIWCNEAEVTEMIPESRATEAWLLQRYYRIGNTMAVRYKIQNHLILAYIKGLGFALGELFTFWAYRIGFIRHKDPKSSRIKRISHLNICKGIFNGLLGKKVFEEYRQQHGY